MDPSWEFQQGFYGWNIGFAIGKSNRQLNDWYTKKKNKRAFSLNKKLVGRSGIKFIRKGFEEVLKLRWYIQPGDAIVLDCTSGEPEKQFRAWKRWQAFHPDILVKEERKEFIWHRPPHHIDPIWKSHKIIGKIPPFPNKSISGKRYFDCFHAEKLEGNLVTHDQKISIEIPKF